MTQHTPGPWRSYSSGCARVVYGKDSIGADRRIAEMIGRDDEANARLIAAAPQMLEALRDVQKAHQDMFDVMPVAWQTFAHIVDEAIAAATGEQ